MNYATATAPVPTDLGARDPLIAIARWAVAADRDAAAHANTRKDYGGLLQKDERLLEALCGVGPWI